MSDCRTQMEQEAQTPRELLEASQIQWRRDWDALLAGFVVGALLGILSTVAVLVALT